MRGLRADPNERWPSVAALRAALLESVRPERRSPAYAGLALLVVVGGAVWIGSDDCDRREIAWDAARRSAVRESVVDALDDEAATEVLRVLDTRVDLLRTAGADACIAPHTSDASCLRDAGTQLATTIEILERGDPFASRSALAMVEALPDPDGCARAAGVPASEGRFVAERDALARARALELAGLAKDVLAVVEPAIASASERGAGAAGIVAELELFAASAHEELGMPEASLDGFRRSYYAAVEADDARLAMQAAMRVAVALAEQGEHDAAATWLGHEDASRARATFSRHEEARRDSQLAMVVALRGDLEQSTATMQRAIDACANGVCPRTYVASLTNLVQLHLRAGAADRAVELARQAVAASETTGAEIDGALVRIDLASALSLQQHHREALEQIDIATAILERLGAGSSPLAARASFTAAQALAALGRGAEAVAAAERAWTLVQAQTLPGDPRRESYRASLASTRADAGDLRGALRDLDGLLAEESSDPINRAAALVARGDARHQVGELDGAIADARAARALMLEVAPTRTDWIVQTYVNELAGLHLRDGCERAIASTPDMLAWVDAHGTVADRDALRGKVGALATECGQTR
jgi:tetratricopeptide (TPR) repeat protein